jgi:hypothetical protein
MQLRVADHLNRSLIARQVTRLASTITSKPMVCMVSLRRIFGGAARRLGFPFDRDRKTPDVPMSELAAEAARELLDAGIETEVPVSVQSSDRDPLARG